MSLDHIKAVNPVPGDIFWIVKRIGHDGVTYRHKGVVMSVEGDKAMIAFATSQLCGYPVMMRVHPNSDVATEMGLFKTSFITLCPIKTEALFESNSKISEHVFDLLKKAAKKVKK